MSIKLDKFNKGIAITSGSQLRKNWANKIIDLLDKSDSLLTRSEIRDKLNMSSVQEVKQYADKLVKQEKIIAKSFDNAPSKYYYTTQKAIAKISKKQ